MAVSTGAMIKHLDVIIDLGIGAITRLVDSRFDPLLLQTANKRVGHCVLPAVATPDHTGFKVMRMAEAPPRLTANLRSLV